MATALTLVNRVRRQLRWGDTSAFDDDQSKVVLDRLNDAIASIHSLFDWRSDVRDNGIQELVPTTALTTVTVTKASSTLGFATIADIQRFINNRGIPFAVVTSAASFSDTAMRLASTISVGVSATTVAMSKSWAGETESGLSGTIGCNQYVLPDTVRKILGMYQQEVRDSQLVIHGEEETVERFTVRPHGMTAPYVKHAYIIGRSVPFYASDGTPASPALTVLFHPTPSARIFVQYDYMYSHPELTAVGSEYNSSRVFEDLVVSMAFARCTQDSVGDANAADGLALEARVLERAGALQRTHGFKTDEQKNAATMARQAG